MTPKSLLRHKHCISDLDDFNKKNSFHRVLWDHAIDPKTTGFIKLKKSKNIKKVIICSGKIYFDLLEAREKFKKDDIVFYRVEQLYPFPVKALAKELKPYAKNANFYWCQEEPKNMGAWFMIRHRLEEILNETKKGFKLNVVARNSSAAPAGGYQKYHFKRQKEIVTKALEL